MSSSLWPLSVSQAASRIRGRDPVLHAYVSTRLEEALDEARAASLANLPLTGVPFGLKDAWDTAGISTTGGSFRFRERVPSTSSPVFDVFRAAGAVLVGKTSLSDMSLAPEATNYLVGPTRNPFDVSRTAGGSSGGAASAVADGMESFDWGTDIGGSIRMPAAFCGVLGLRLSSETWPILGMFPAPPVTLGWMCGQGPITRTVEQMRALLVIAKRTLRTGASRRFELRSALIYAPDRPGEWSTFARDVEAAARAAGGGALAGERDAPLPATTPVRNVYASLWASHFEELVAADHTLSLFGGLRAVLSAIAFRGAFGDRRFHPLTAELLGLIALGRVTLYRDPARALAAARRIRDAFDDAWDRGCLIVAPTSVYPAPRIGRVTRNAQILSCVIPGNIADATCISIPFGRFADGLPRALQLMGPPGSEDVVLDAAERVIGKA